MLVKKTAPPAIDAGKTINVTTSGYASGGSGAGGMNQTGRVQLRPIKEERVPTSTQAQIT